MLKFTAICAGESEEKEELDQLVDEIMVKQIDNLDEDEKSGLESMMLSQNIPLN